MPADKAIIGARLRAEREDNSWSREEMARRLRAVSDKALPSIENLAHMIKEWEKGKHGVSGPYRTLYSAAFGLDERTLFGGRQDPTTALWRSPDGWITPDDEERLTLAVARPARLDAGALGALSAILAGQRRLEDALGPAALIDTVMAQTRGIAAVLRETRGPQRGELGWIVAEWTTFAGWLHAALRQDAHALKLFGLAEDLADDFDHGTGAALATSFRGYVARKQGRPRAVVRAASASLATPGVHQTQQTFDTLQAAQGYAALGERDEARRLLDVAADLADDAGEPPPPVYWYSKPFFRLNIGVVHAGIGEYRDAADMLSSGLDGMPPDQREAEWLHEYKDALTEAKDRA
jgi:transcriptional regulator with XRE-family HTH domain